MAPATRKGRQRKVLGLNHRASSRPYGQDNPLARPEEFDVTGLVRPGAPNAIALGLDPARRSDLVYWLEGFEIAIEQGRPGSTGNAPNALDAR